MRIALAALFLCLSPAQATPLHIRNDNGGEVFRYAVRVLHLIRSGEEVRVSGRCDSACTLFLSAPTLCILPGASFGFHLPYGGPEAANRIAARYMMRRYPAWVRAWLRERGGLSGSIKRMGYGEAVRHVGRCGASPSVNQEMAS